MIRGGGRNKKMLTRASNSLDQSFNECSPAKSFLRYIMQLQRHTQRSSTDTCLRYTCCMHPLPKTHLSYASFAYICTKTPIMKRSKLLQADSMARQIGIQPTRNKEGGP